MSMKHQRGGTIVGFIIGVLVGLGGALAVAVYVTKVPVPFLNKGQSRTPEQDAAEIKKNKDWDPNAPLYGKNPARPASAALPSTSAGGSATATVTATPVVPAAPASAARSGPKAEGKVEAKTEARPAASSDPLGDLAKSRAGAVPAATGGDPFSYFVQAGAYRTPEDAEAQRVKLSLLGIEAKVTEREQSGRTVFRVRAGPFDKKEEAEKAKEKIDAGGIETALVRVQR
jgi:cell division protein FtsN